jgi:hypothetical protein
MLRKKLIVFFTLVVGCGALTDLRAAPIPENLKQIVTFIFLADQNGNLLRDKEGNPVAYGTGFFVGVPRETGKPEALGYFVTAKHVLKDMNGKLFSTVFLRLDRKNSDAEFVRLNIDPKSVYEHTDATVDVAVIPLLPSADIYDFKILSTDDFASPEKLKTLKVSEGSDVFFTGLLTNYYGGSKNTPVVRFGRVAMFPHQPIPWKEKPSDPVTKPQLYLLETQSFGGNSGSPVFFYESSDPGVLRVGPSQLALAGVMRGTLERRGVVEFVPTADVPVYRQNIGIAAVTPAYQILEILNIDELKKVRAEYFSSHPPLALPNEGKELQPK